MFFCFHCNRLHKYDFRCEQQFTQKKEDGLTLWRYPGRHLLYVILLCSFLPLPFQLGESVALSTVAALLWSLFAGFQSSCFFFAVPSAWRAVRADNCWHTQRYRHSKRLRYVDGSALMPRRRLQWEETSWKGGSGGAVVWGSRVQHPPVFWGGGLVATEVVTFKHLELLWQVFLRGLRALLVLADIPATRCPPSVLPFKLPVLIMFADVTERVGSQRSGFYIRNENTAWSTSWTIASCSVIICNSKSKSDKY